MISMADFAKRAEKFTTDNSPLILTALGTVGVVTTAVLVGKASFKASDILRDEEDRRFDETGTLTASRLDYKEKVKLTWTLYIPATTSAVLTCGAVIGANQIGTRRAAAVAAAFSLSEKAFGEYKEQVAKKFGETKASVIVDEVQQERMNRNPVQDREVIILTGEQLCYDSYSGRYFQSDMESLKKAMNDLNFKINNNNYASLSDFYDLIGLDRTAVSEDVGWNLDKLLDIHFSTVLATDGRPAIALEYRVEPIRNYFRVH